MRDAFKLIWSADKRRFLLKLLYTVVANLLPLMNLYVLKVLVDTVAAAVTGGVVDMGGVAVVIVVFSAVTLCGHLVGVASSLNDEVLVQRIVDHISQRIQEQSQRLDMAYYDCPEFHDTLHRAQQEASYRPVRIVENVASVVGAAITLAGVAAIMAVGSWQVLLIMFVAVVPSFLARLYRSRRIYRFRRETTAMSRLSSYYSTILTGRAYAKEVRAFGLADHFRKRYKELRRRMVTMLVALARRLSVVDAASGVVEAVALGIAIAVLVRPVLGGTLTLGTFVMLFEAFRRGPSSLNTMAAGIAGLYEQKLFINNLFEFLNLDPTITTPTDAVPFPERVEEVRFDDITFAYPEMQRPVFSHFSLKARSGEVTVIEGHNGFGKTTMLKLLLRFYDPQEGAVYVNGTDIRRFDVIELRKHIGAIFQDFVQYQLTARENVTLGNIDRQSSDGVLLERVLRQSESDAVVAGLHNGIDTCLGRQFEGGEELSMGQWQRIALARQLYTDAPILFFDEPMAWMDAEARARFVATLDDLKRDRVVFLVVHGGYHKG